MTNPDARYVDFSQFPEELHEKISEIMQKVALEASLSWNTGHKNLYPYATNIGYSTGEDAPGLYADCVYVGWTPVTLTEWLAWIREVGTRRKPQGPVYVDFPYNAIGEQVFAWYFDKIDILDLGKLQAIDDSDDMEPYYLKYASTSISYAHIARINGHEERLFLPYDQWPNHEEEV